MRRVIAVLGLLAMAVVVPTSPVAACSLGPPPLLDEVVAAGDGTLAGIYEQTNIAPAPGIGPLRDTTVSVVTRYWGEPPQHLGREIHREPDCGLGPGVDGTVTYGAVYAGYVPGYGRGYSGVGVGPDPWDLTGPISAAQEAALTARFGPPTVLDAGLVTRGLAWLAAWRIVVLTPAVLLLVPYTIWDRRRDRETWRRPAVAAAAVAALTGAALLAAVSGDGDPLLAAFVGLGALAAAWAGVATSIAFVALVAAVAWTPGGMSLTHFRGPEVFATGVYLFVAGCGVAARSAPSRRPLVLVVMGVAGGFLGGSLLHLDRAPNGNLAISLLALAGAGVAVVVGALLTRRAPNPSRGAPQVPAAPGRDHAP